MGYQALYSNTSGSENTAMGNGALQNTTGSENTAVGYGAGFHLSGGSNNTYIGYNADASANNVTRNNETVIGAGATGYGDNTITLGNVHALGLYCQVGLTATSDRRVKRDIQPTSLGLDFIDKLSPVRYKRVNPADYPEPLLEKRYKGDDPDPRPEDNDKVYDGLIAQDVEQAMKDLGVEWSGHDVNDATERQGLQYELLVIPLINAVKELKQRIEVLENKM